MTTWPFDEGASDDPVTRALSDIAERVVAQDLGGVVADYIPALAAADPNDFGLAVTSVRGRSYSARVPRSPFTIQSISKPFVFALALTEHGRDTVLEHVGVEPSGEAFNAISFDQRGRPANPMINAGALVATSLISASDAAERFSRIQEGLSAFAGRALVLDDAVYRSESETGDRNRALATLARASGVLTTTVDEATEPYFKQCSLLVDCNDLAAMASTLANGGVNPVTGCRVVSEEVAMDTVSVMTACGMYDRSGQWNVEVGMPAKSGVSGGILAVAPGQYGIGVFSPPLDESGNSSRGVAALNLLSHDFDLHMFHHSHVLPPSAREMITGPVDSVLTLRLKGRVDFVTAEDIVAEVARSAETIAAEAFVIDLCDVLSVSSVAARVLRALVQVLRAGGYSLHVNDPEGFLRE